MNTTIPIQQGHITGRTIVNLTSPWLAISVNTPIPTSPHAGGDLENLRLQLAAMEHGNSFVWPKANQTVYRAAADIGVKVRLKKLNGTGYRVWRLT